VKILAKFLLSSVFVFLAAVGCAQDILGLHDDCGFAPALKGFTVETSVWINNKLIEEVSPQIVEMLEDRVNCLNDNMMQMNASVKSLQSPLISNENLTTDILLLQDKLKQTELDLHTAETKVEDQEASLHLIERRLAMAEDEIEWLTPKARASKPKAPVSKPTSGFIPDTPATTPHPASKKSDAGKPKAPANKPTPAVKEGTH
jgi:hypothetical protein